MADVVLHCGPGPAAAGLCALLERTERLLESFPCRTPPVFSPWFPAGADCHAPIRPARPAPVIVYQPQEPEEDKTPEATPSLCSAALESSVFLMGSDTPDSIQRTPALSAAEHKDAVAVADSPLKRSWSVFTQRGALRTETLSKTFCRAVAVHRLHLQQRAKWVISQHNCGPAGDIEQVWRALIRFSRSAGLSSCNANIQRDRAEIWVFCDVGCSEGVGRFLMEELQLSGGIELSVHGRGNVFSLLN